MKNRRQARSAMYDITNSPDVGNAIDKIRKNYHPSDHFTNICEVCGHYIGGTPGKRGIKDHSRCAKIRQAKYRGKV